MTSVADPELTARAEQTRAAIVRSAMRLFRENGYEATTMRAIAQDAGVSTGNASTTSGSKEELVQAFHAAYQAKHIAACQPVLDRETDFAARLRGTLRALIGVSMPYHEFAARFFKYAAEPASPLSPLSKESSPARDAAIALYGEVVRRIRAAHRPRAARPAARAALAVLAGGHPVLGCTTPRRAAPRPTS